MSKKTVIETIAFLLGAYAGVIVSSILFPTLK